VRSTVTALVAALALAAGCGDGGSGAATDPTSVTTTTAAAAAGEATTTTAATEETDGISELEALAPELLVAAAELPVAGIGDLGYSPAGSLPGCDFVLDDEVPPDLNVGTSLGANGLAFVTEVIRVYSDADAAASAFATAVANEEPCRSHEQSFSGPTDVNDRIGADRAVAFSALDRGGPTEVVYALVGDALVSFEFPPPADPTGPPPLDVAAFGVGKILAALEA
jgi:hypothetical protein